MALRAPPKGAALKHGGTNIRNQPILPVKADRIPSSVSLRVLGAKINALHALPRGPWMKRNQYILPVNTHRIPSSVTLRWLVGFFNCSRRLQ
eukprot:4529419-Pyramimonas_sp.AAC.1